MKRSSIIFFQIVIVFIGIGALALMLWEPHLEGRNTHATWFQIYFNDPFLAYAYVASIPFFLALYHGFKALGYATQVKVFSHEISRALRIIKYCAIVIIGFVVVGEMLILLNESDDRAGGVFIGVLVILGSILIAAMATIFERILQKATDKEPRKKGL